MTIFKPDKPFKTYDEQLSLLKERGLIITNDDYARHALQTYSYYDLINGNLDKLLVSKHPIHFQEETSIELLVRIRSIEDRIKSVFLSQILMIEKNFKTVLSYHIADQFGVNSGIDGYLTKTNYPHSSSKKGIVKKTLKQLIDVRDGNTKIIQGLPIKHYRKNHNHIPPWILIDELSFGQTYYWFNSLKFEDEILVSKKMLSLKSSKVSDADYTELFKDAMTCLRQFRNFFAHNSVLSQMQCSQQLKLQKIKKILNDDIVIQNTEIIFKNRNNLFACFLCVMLLSNDSDQLNIFLLGLEQTISSLSNEVEAEFIIYDIFKLPINSVTRAEHFVKKYNPTWPSPYQSSRR
ncbi:hypothetical protein AYR62_10595 [Secundilactobacillus paracollinoides]|uniref:Abi family protein n=1 Tax=Secundilactobacillus paracollinoides TaxID=240427 RepID=UPI00081A4702|nr:Abi family protein [Secundilactobacillus paracollinoides]ANZ64488.1 hypothetical protein AYR62_10595 [Secundilactobacillus paracollinoides]